MDRAREMLRKTMVMGLPADEERWPRFRVLVEPAAVSGPVDGNGVPYDPDAVVTPAVYDFVRPVCIVETSSSDDSPWLQPGQALVTIFDVDYESVQGADILELWLGGPGSGPASYRFDRVVQQPTLETLGVWQLLFKTEDQA